MSDQKELEALKRKLNLYETKIEEQKHLLQQLKDKIECPVCMEVPRSGPVPVCPNGHFVCKKCKTDACPTCRTAMGSGKSLLAATILEKVEHRCNSEDCEEQFALKDIYEHEKVCPYRIVSCPDFDCTERVSLAKLVDHLRKSNECCGEEAAPLGALDDWNSRNFTIVDAFQKNLTWIMNMYDYAGETFAVFPVIIDGDYYFVVVMFASETECSKYKLEMIIHDQEQTSDAQMTVKFQGNPLSIDEKEGLCLYSTGGQFMRRIMKKPNPEKDAGFQMSFKISKIE
eukprot:GFUD01030182.1.p1 GENE.GFUD01030182.1~~GFUD01030182.1.p1  ORF type:complete len:285 (+),score=53.40 GFUD01030182.1:97-951(+)